MTTADAISLGITIGLGLLSVGLGAFAIWLSYRFASQSGSALDSLRTLAAEMRVLIDASLSQQKDFSSKMLDSILSRDQYGAETGVSKRALDLEATIRKGMAESESRITAQVERQVRSIAAKAIDPDALDRALSSIRAEIGTLADKAIQTAAASVSLPEQLRDELIEGKLFPARILLLIAIAAEGVTEPDQLAPLQERCAFPHGWKGPISTWLKSGLLTGTEDHFSMPEAVRAPLLLWAETHRPVIEQIRESQRSLNTKQHSSDDLHSIRRIAEALRV